ncbi:MAG TPA: hypothetical protein VH113_09615 [Gemmatimonadales bacterium]|nr:hypothetical protein [Gemmatimonadales bacterium]
MIDGVGPEWLAHERRGECATLHRDNHVEGAVEDALGDVRWIRVLEHQGDFRVVPPEQVLGLPRNAGGDGREHRPHHQPPAPPRRYRCGSIEGRRRLLQQPRGSGGKGDSGKGRRDAPRVPLQELDPELLFQVLHGAGEGGLGDVRSFGRRGEAPRFGHGREVPQVAEFQVVSRYASAL